MYDDFEFYENIVSPIPDGDHANENESKSVQVSDMSGCDADNPEGLEEGKLAVKARKAPAPYAE